MCKFWKAARRLLFNKLTKIMFSVSSEIKFTGLWNEKQTAVWLAFTKSVRTSFLFGDVFFSSINKYLAACFEIFPRIRIAKKWKFNSKPQHCLKLLSSCCFNNRLAFKWFWNYNLCERFQKIHQVNSLSKEWDEKCWLKTFTFSNDFIESGRNMKCCVLRSYDLWFFLIIHGCSYFYCLLIPSTILFFKTQRDCYLNLTKRLKFLTTSFQNSFSHQCR